MVEADLGPAGRGAITNRPGAERSHRFVADNWGLPYLTERIERTHNFEHAFAFERNPRTDARPLGPIAHCYGKPSVYPGEDYPGWPEGTQPDPSHFV